MINDDEKSVGILFLSILDSKSTIEECIKKSGLTADKISTLISIPKFNKYFELKLASVFRDTEENFILLSYIYFSLSY